MSRPRLLDLFCGAGGAAMGYHRAGFDVVGVDINPQPHYPFEFHQGDAMTWPLEGFDAIHASPPCQAYSPLTGKKAQANHPDLYGPTRDRLVACGVPWVIENVIPSPYRSGIVLCGSMFNLAIKRHRNFETRDLILMPFLCDHSGERPTTITTSNGTTRGTIDYKHSRQTDFATGRGLMGMPWAETQREIGLAIPPAYTEWIGQQLMRQILWQYTAAI
jgi:DNA (cytosine-5)-methyltransferase 1